MNFVGPMIAVTPIQSLHLYLAKFGEWGHGDLCLRADPAAQQALT